MGGTEQATGPPAWSGRLLARRRLAAGTFELRLNRPKGFDFQAGQYVTLHVGGTTREYSLADAPQARHLTILVRRIPGGRVTGFLDQAPAGADIPFDGPDGHFTFRGARRPVVMVATGTGIAPLAAMIRAGARPDVLLHGVRTADELYYREEIQAAARRYVPCLSGGAELPAHAFGGYVTRFIETRLDPLEADFYLAGRTAMIHAVMGIIDARFPTARVYTEAFF